MGDFIREDPLLMAYFAAVVLIMSVSLMNLVTVLIVEGAMNQSATEKHVARQLRLKEFEGKCRNFWRFTGRSTRMDPEA